MVPSHMDWVPPASFDEYRLIKALGRGSMGQVWLAHDTVLDRQVAVKFIAALSAHDAVRQRFLTEARAAARVQHPNIIAVYRVGEIGPRPYLISEYVRGESLDKIARPVAWPRLFEIAIGLARGLAAAQGRGVLHRDLKPANAIVSETGEVKLLDFGLAKLLPHVEPPHTDLPPNHEPRAQAPNILDELLVTPEAKRPSPVVSSDRDASTVDVVTGEEAKLPGSGIAVPPVTPAGVARAMESPGPNPAIGPGPSITRTGAMMGTPAYMAPELWRGEPATARSDVYSLGALLYELGAGAPPHCGGSPEAVRESTIAAEATSLRISAPGIHPGFAAIVDRCLRRDPTERFASGDAVREALEALAGDDDIGASVRTQPLGRRLLGRSRWAVVLGAAVAVAVFAYSRAGGDRSPPPVGAAVANNALPDASVQDSPEPPTLAVGSPPIGAAGRCPEGMVPVAARTFQMGSPNGVGEEDEHPQHQVTLSAYCIDKTEVTVEAYTLCVAAKHCSAAPITVKWEGYSEEQVKRYSPFCNVIRDDRQKHPINCVDWDQAKAYCAWVDKRLPTEAEWEYAARGSDGRKYPWGNDEPSATRLNACGSECVAMAKRDLKQDWAKMYEASDGWETTAPVGRFPDGASPFGALDMAGNVWEWTADWYSTYSGAAVANPHGAKTGEARVIRGGGWYINDAALVRAADRIRIKASYRHSHVGFRCARGR